MGDDWICRCGSVFLSIGESGDDARMGEDESGEGTAGRWSQEKIGAGAKDIILSGVCLLLSECFIDRRSRNKGTLLQVVWRESCDVMGRNWEKERRGKDRS